MIMVVKSMEPRRIRIPQEAKERRDRLVAGRRCVGCERELVLTKKVQRGLCPTCYSATRKAVRNRRITDEELLRRGRILPPAAGGPKPHNEFTRELSEM